MADGRKNPLIGAFRTPVAETPPKASEPSKADESKMSHWSIWPTIWSNWTPIPRRCNP